jgi:hypothetical protein
MTNSQSSNIDFDYWLNLAQNDPERFESLRQEMLESHIRRASDTQQTRLRRLQWRIDRVREQAKSPMAACISISDMMWDTFNHLANGYQHVELLKRGQESKPGKATVLPFTPRQA